MKLEWLNKRVTVQEAEAANMHQDKRLGRQPVAFGFQNSQWLKLLSGFQPGDEIWEFASPPDTWEKMCGRAGYALVRQREILDVIITMMN